MHDANKKFSYPRTPRGRALQLSNNAVNTKLFQNLTVNPLEDDLMSAENRILNMKVKEEAALNNPAPKTLVKKSNKRCNQNGYRLKNKEEGWGKEKIFWKNELKGSQPKSKISPSKIYEKMHLTTLNALNSCNLRCPELTGLL